MTEQHRLEYKLDQQMDEVQVETHWGLGTLNKIDVRQVLGDIHTGEERRNAGENEAQTEFLQMSTLTD